MGRKPDFIGLGAQKAGTSWIYSCLYEHPQVCMPLKEIHFFSRPRNWENGYEWYEEIFAECSSDAKAGEFSTTYLFNPLSPERIYQRYPQVKLIASLRNPMERAYSNYINTIKSGVVHRDVPFEEAMKEHPEYVEQGRYASQLQRYLSYFERKQILLLVYEDCLSRPLEFMQSIYRFIGVEENFEPSMLNKKVNVSKVPRFVLLERGLIRMGKTLQKSRYLRKFWWAAKKIGLANFVRQFNIQQTSETTHSLETASMWKEMVYKKLEMEITNLEQILGRNLPEWRL